MELAAGSQGQQRGLRRGSIARNQSAKPGGSGATLTSKVQFSKKKGLMNLSVIVTTN